MPINLITATHIDFEPLTGRKFHVELEGAQVELILDNVKIFESSAKRDNHLEIDDVVYPARQPFALTFEGPSEPILESRIYTISNEKTGKMDLLISAFRQDHDCMLYECVFS